MLTIPGAGPLRQYALCSETGGILVTADHPRELWPYVKLATMPTGERLLQRLGRLDVVDRHTMMLTPGGDMAASGEGEAA